MKKLIKYLSILILIIIAYYGFTTYPKLDIVSGFSSKSVASHLYIAGRDKEMTELEDNDVPSMNMANNEVNEVEKSVTSTLDVPSKESAFPIAPAPVTAPIMAPSLAPTESAAIVAPAAVSSSSVQ